MRFQQTHNRRVIDSKQFNDFFAKRNEEKIELVARPFAFVLSSEGDGSHVVRGIRKRNEADALPSALNGFLYSILKNTKAQRRGILTSLLKQFDDTAVR